MIAMTLVKTSSAKEALSAPLIIGILHGEHWAAETSSILDIAKSKGVLNASNLSALSETLVNATNASGVREDAKIMTDTLEHSLDGAESADLLVVLAMAIARTEVHVLRIHYS